MQKNSQDVVHISRDDFPNKFLNVDLSFAKYIHIDLGGELNIIQLAYTNFNVRSQLIRLANFGFYLYQHKNGISSLVQHHEIDKIWPKVKTGEIKFYKNVFYTLTPPLVKSDSNFLLVIFSSISDKPFSSSLYERYFTQNFSSIHKYIPPNTTILRIADVGGVVGGFYMNTIFDDGVEERIQELIEYVIESEGVDSKNVILYGVSKGGSASLYHGLLGCYNSIFVDPIVSDDFYVNHSNDSHFTLGVFPFDKQTKINNALKNANANQNLCLIYSERSPQFSFINKMLDNCGDGDPVAIFNSINPRISSHADVGFNTVNIVVTLINSIFYDLLNKPKIRKDFI